MSVYGDPSMPTVSLSDAEEFKPESESALGGETSGIFAVPSTATISRPIKTNRGRPSKAGSWNRDRINSCGSLKDFFRPKRKREFDSVLDDSSPTSVLSSVDDLLSFGDIQPALKRSSSAVTVNTSENERSEESMEAKLELIHKDFLDKFAELKTHLTKENVELQNKFSEMKNEVTKEISNIKADVVLFKQNVAESDARYQQSFLNMNSKIDALTSRLEHQDKLRRKNNVISRGLAIDAANLLRDVNVYFQTKFDVSNAVIEVTPLAPYNDRLLIKFSSFEMKQKVMSAKATILRNSNTFLDHDFTPRENNIMKMARDRVRAERTRGNQAKTGYLRFIINGEQFVWSDTSNDFAPQASKRSLPLVPVVANPGAATSAPAATTSKNGFQPAKSWMPMAL